MAVIEALAQEPAVWRYGYDLCQQLGMKAGSMYPILMRLADRGMLETTWATEAEPGRPPRHLYRLTGTGLALAGQLAAAATTAAPLQPRARGRADRGEAETRR